MGQLIQGVNDLQTKYPRLLDPRLPNTNSAIRIDCADDGRKGKLDDFLNGPFLLQTHYCGDNRSELIP